MRARDDDAGALEPYWSDGESGPKWLLGSAGPDGDPAPTLTFVGKKLVLCVIDGLTPATLERGVENGRLPVLSYLAAQGEYARGVSAFPSVTPVCLSSIATGSWPDVHGIPHIVWWTAEEQRVVEYGSSLGAVLAAGIGGVVRDAVLNMSASHLSPEATTVFEAVEDAGLVAGAITFTCYRGRTRHRIRLPELARRNRWYEAVNGPQPLLLLQPLRVGRDGGAARRSLPHGRLRRPLRGPRRPLAGDARRVRLPRLLPPRLRLRVACRRPRRRRARPRARRRGPARARAGRRRPRRLPRPLRDRRLLRPRADASQARRPPGGALRRPRPAGTPATASRARRRRRLRLEPGGDGLPAARVHAVRAERSRSDSTTSRLSTSRCFAKTGSPWPAGRERSFASPPVPIGSGSRATRRCSTRRSIRAASSGRGQRLPAPGRETSSSPRPTATSSPTSADGITPAAAATARSWPGTRSCPCSPVAWRRLSRPTPASPI